MKNFSYRAMIYMFTFLLIFLLFTGCKKGVDPHSHGGNEEEQATHGEKHEEHQEGATKFITLEKEVIENIGIKSKKIESTTIPIYLEAIGEVIANANSLVNITPIVGGKVKEVHINLGDYVSRGQLIAIVSSPELATAIADFRASDEKMQIAVKHLGIVQEFAKTGAFSGPPLENKKEELSRAKTDFITAKENLKIAETHLNVASLEEKKITAISETGEYGKRPLDEAKDLFAKAESDYLQAKNELEKAETEIERSEKLYKAGLISKKELLSVQTAYQNTLVYNSQTKAQMEVAKGILQREQSVYDKDVRSQVEIQTGKAKYIQAQKESEQAMAAFENAKETLNIIEIQMKREENIYDRNLNTAQQLQEAEASYKEAQIEYEKAVSVLDTFNITPEDAYLYAGGSLPVFSPIKGKVIERNVNKGEVVSNYTVIFKILDDSTLWIDSEIYEKDFTKVKTGQTVEIATEAYPGEFFSGKIFYISNTFHQETRTFDIRFAFDNSKNLLKPGMTVNSKIATGETTGLILPTGSVLDDEGTKVIFVAVKGKGNVFERRTVEIEPLKNNEYAVLSGLSPGEEVVIEGSLQLRSEANRKSLEGGHED